MNCQDISRIADTGSFGGLTEAERREAEAHALACRHCAPVWAAHSRLAVLPIAPMPSELSARCRTLAAMPARTQGRPALRRLTLVGGLVAMAAAAGMLAIRPTGTRAPESRQSAVATPAVEDPAPAPATPEVAAPVVAEAIAATPAPAEAARAQSSHALPLLPAPDLSARNAAVDLALQKAVERHPELVEGPETDGMFVVDMAMQEDGRVASSTAQLWAPPDGFRGSVGAEVGGTNVGDQSAANFRKHTLLSDGRSLRADVRLQVSVIPDSQDPTRSVARILETVRRQHADLLLPVAGGEVNRLTIFLSENGSIQREEVEHTTLQNLVSIRSDDPDFVAGFAQYIAARLALDVEQIGLMGSIPLEEGKAPVVVAESGEVRDDERRLLIVNYAYPRRAGESAPVFRRNSNAARYLVFPQPTFDQAAALAIVKRQIPDAFTVKDLMSGFPAVVLTHKGEFIRAGRLPVQMGVPAAPGSPLAQLVPGIRVNSIMSRGIKDETGATADVLFAWEAPVAETAKPAK